MKNLSQLLKINTYLNRLMQEGSELGIKQDLKPDGTLTLNGNSNENSK